MAGRYAESLKRDTKEGHACLDQALRRQIQAAEAFASGLEQAISDYELMLAVQRYLLDVSAIARDVSKIFGYSNLLTAVSSLEASAWTCLDSSDLMAQTQGIDGRFSLDEEGSRFLRSGLGVIAKRASRMAVVYSRILQEAVDPSRLALRFLLDLVLDLPIGAWECAPCIAFAGRCEECGYGRDHGLCSGSGSAYAVLRRSREALLEGIRRDLTWAGRTSEEAPPIDWQVGLCAEGDIVELCD